MKEKFLQTLLVVLSISMGLVCCNAPGDKSQDKFVVKAYEILDGQSVVNLSEIASSISYIPLETTDSSMVSNISSIHYQSGKIYVRDNTDKIFVFSDKGKFINVINRKGRGPEEYSEIRSFAPSAAGELYILSGQGDFLKYDQSGKFISRKKIVTDEERVTFDKFEFVGNNIMVTAYSMLLRGSEPTVKNLYFFCDDTLGVIMSDVREQHNAMKITHSGGQVSAISIRWDPFYINRFGDYARLYYPGRDTVFNVSKDGGFEQFFAIDYGNYGIKEGSDPFAPRHEQDHISLATPFFETNNHLLLNFMAGKYAPEKVEQPATMINGMEYKSVDANILAIAEKGTGKLKALARPAEGENGFKEDLEGGPVFWPSYTGAGGEFISYKNAYQILDAAGKAGEASRSLQSLASLLKEEDNPVVIIVKPKR